MRGGCVLTSIPMPARRNPGPGSVVAETAVGHIRAPFSGGGLRSRPVARCAGAGKVWHGSGMGLAWVWHGCAGVARVARGCRNRQGSGRVGQRGQREARERGRGEERGNFSKIIHGYEKTKKQKPRCGKSTGAYYMLGGSRHIHIGVPSGPTHVKTHAQ